MANADKAAFVARYGSIYEHSPWVAERAWDVLADSADVADIATAMARCVDTASDAEKSRLICAHPDLAGRAAVHGELTVASSGEQTSAGIDQCTPDEFERFQKLNKRYKEKFDFPFVMAVRGSNRHAILAAFEERLQNDAQAEFARALNEIHKIARLRLGALQQQEGNAT
jgi:OHCU decarboxylase